MSVRPICITFINELENVRDSWLLGLAEELAASVLTKRAHAPFKTVPSPFGNSDIDEMEDRTIQTHRTTKTDLVLKAVYGISLADIVLTSSSPAFIPTNPLDTKQFIKLVECVTPACFTRQPELTRHLRAEGVPLELMFVLLVLQASIETEISTISARNRLHALYVTNGPDSVIWLRIFLSMLDRVSFKPTDDVIACALEMLCINSIDDAIIDEAMNIPVTWKWCRSWLEEHQISK